jgi:hypothetical protein
MQTQTHKTHHVLDLEEATTFPLIIYSMPNNGTSTQCHFVSRLPSGNLEIPKIRALATLEAHNFVCRLLIEVRSEEKVVSLVKSSSTICGMPPSRKEVRAILDF